MIKRFRILAETPGREVPEIGSEAVFRVIPISQLSGAPEDIHVVISAADPLWGPRIARIEGFVADKDGSVHTVLGFHAIGVSDNAYIGLLEVHFDEA